MYSINIIIIINIFNKLKRGEIPMGDAILRNEDIIELKKCIFSSMVCLFYLNFLSQIFNGFNHRDKVYHQYVLIM